MSNSFATPWTVACQAPLSMGFSRQEYWSGLPFSIPGDLPNPGIEPTCTVDSLPLSLLGRPQWGLVACKVKGLGGGCFTSFSQFICIPPAWFLSYFFAISTVNIFFFKMCHLKKNPPEVISGGNYDWLKLETAITWQRQILKSITVTIVHIPHTCRVSHLEKYCLHPKIRLTVSFFGRQ